MFALVLIRYRRPIEEVVAATDDHRKYLRDLHARGILVASGPFDPRTGGALILRLPDEDVDGALDAIRDADPFWQRGIANYELLKWNPNIGMTENGERRTENGERMTENGGWSETAPP